MTHYCGINRMKEGTDFEKKHTPFIECKDRVKANAYFEVKISTGIPHPMEDAHFIHWIELYMGDLYLARVDFTQFMKPEVKMMVKAPSKEHEKFTLRALMRCNLHGVWEYEKEILLE
ncbi:Superoxide reductase [Methanocaldococcus vulcanius M7]|uniref:Superoxide reductase n=1 Tax=Methanocaldococcus vulcanius (strain ATCC 700851 / DSM 12094 / M7) TaxID=579137 RepID=C9RFE7_METVM|nr:desulfoferrodoxin family protein [Methanocaldococcus vulcanius]ACX72299.1 Superoxide reductase [Methanocaldococcus vulcanius M7]